jgi:hypothetical protein
MQGSADAPSNEDAGPDEAVPATKSTKLPIETQDPPRLG